MRPSIAHWLDWVVNQASRTVRRAPRPTRVSLRYQLAGQVFTEGLIPWNAEGVVVEALCRLPPNARRRSELGFRLPNSPAIPVEFLPPQHEEWCRLLCRFPPPRQSVWAELCYRGRRIARIALPILEESQFRDGFEVCSSSVSVVLGQESVSAVRFVARQGRGLMATAFIRSRVPLTPLADGGLQVEFRHDPSGMVTHIPIRLTRNQLLSSEVCITAGLTRLPRMVGRWTIRWLVFGEVKAEHWLEAVSQRAFRSAIRVVASRFIVMDRHGTSHTAQYLPPSDDVQSLGPQFDVCSGESGIAGRCRLSIHAVATNPATSYCLAKQDVLITDVTTRVASMLPQGSHLAHVSAFTLQHRQKMLATLSLSPVPEAVFTAEGGFRPPPEFQWSSAADEELHSRLRRLMNDTDPTA